MATYEVMFVVVVDAETEEEALFEARQYPGREDFDPAQIELLRDVLPEDFMNDGDTTVYEANIRMTWRPTIGRSRKADMKVNEQVLVLLQRLEACITSLDNSMEDTHIKLDGLYIRLDKLEAQVLEVYDNTRSYDSAIEGVHDDINEIKRLIPSVEEVLDDARRAERVGWAKSTKPAF